MPIITLAMLYPKEWCLRPNPVAHTCIPFLQFSLDLEQVDTDALFKVSHSVSASSQSVDSSDSLL